MSTRVALSAILALCASIPAAAQDAPAPPDWSFSAAAYTYVLPDEANYVQPTLAADRGWLHLEARYNYEELETGSAWIGYRVGGGEGLAWEITPMLGGVFGATSGVAPGYKGTVSWRALAGSSEGEYLFAAERSDSFFYNWSEVTVSPADWWRAGVVTQRTHAYASDREVQRGLLAGFTYRDLDAAVYVFNPDDTHPLVVLAVTVGF